MIKFRDNLNRIKPYIPGKPIEEVRREMGIKGDIIKLASNENPVGVSPKALDALNNAVNEVNAYPDDSAFYLKQSIGEKRGCSPENIIIGNGSVEVLNMTVAAVIGEGDALVRSQYAFIMSKLSPIINGAETIDVPMKDFRHDVKGLCRASADKRAKILYIDNPANPIGTMLTGNDIKYIMEHTDNDTLIILDEAYNEYLSDNDRIDSVKLISEYDNLVILSTFSKIYGLAGLRIGYMIAGDNVIKNITKMRLPFNVNLPAQKAALAALNDIEFIERCRDINFAGRNFLNDFLKGMGYDTIESHTNFITFDVRMDSTEVFGAMQKRGVIIRPLKNYGLNNHIRVTVGADKQNRRFADIFKEVINEL